jgi:hypothetical protein
MRSKNRELQNLLQEVSELSGIPSSSEQAEKENKPTYLHFDKMGGYHISISPVGKVHLNCAFGTSVHDGRKSALEMSFFLQGLIAGLSHNKTV